MADHHQGYNHSGLSSNLSQSTSNLSTTSSGTSNSQGGRRPTIIRDAQQRVMLQNIRDSLAHLQKPCLPSPGSDNSGASGTSTPNKDGLQSKDSAKRTTGMDNYHEKALNQIRQSLKNFEKNDDSSEVDDLATTATVDVKKLIQAICPNDGQQHNGQYQSKFGGLVGTIGPHSSTAKKPVNERPKSELLASSQVATINDSAGTASPPPLPPRTRASPPPPLPPPRDHQSGNVTSAVPGGPPSRTTSQYQPLKSRKDSPSSTAASTPRGQSPNPRTITLPGLNQPGVAGANIQTMTSPPSATPPSSIEQLVEQTGLTAEQITKILMEHSVNRNQPSEQMAPSHSSHAAHQHHIPVLPDRISPAVYQQQQPPPPPPHHYNHDIHNTTLNSPPQPGRSATLDHRTQGGQHITVTYHNAAASGQMYSNGGGGQPPPPPQYPSHMINSQSHVMNSGPPPPPYNTPHTPHYHQPSPASSVTSGSSNDYLLVNHCYPNPNGEYRTPAYGESPSSGSSSPASLQGYTPYNYHIHPAAAAAAHHHHHHMLPAPISAREAKHQAVITQSAHSQLVSRPHLQTATAPPNHTQAPPSYTSSIHAQVGSPSHRQGMSPKGGGNVHIELRNHRDPHLQVNGYPSFQVTAQNGQPHNTSNHQLRLCEQNRASIQFQFNTSGAADPSQLRRKGSLETGSNSPVSRTTNQSPLSMISTASTNSDLLPDRPPPPYPGNSRQHNNPPPINSIQQQLGAESSEPSEHEQSETESESERRGTHRCTSPKPKLRPDGEKKDEDRRWTQQRHYSPAAYKFYMEQHVENILKQHKDRVKRRVQLEKEMSKVKLSEEAQNQMRKLLKQKETNHLRLKRAKMNRSMFDIIKKLGIGAFGEVSLVRKRVIDPEEHGGNQLYAMKTLRKVDVIRRNQVAHVKAERDMLAEAELEWVTKLYYSFQDKENLYFIMEYIPGGDLMALLIKKGIFDEPLAMFYIAELVLAIESVHKMGFIHRDIKPDNVLIDKDGHLKLTDFGLCTGFRWTHNSKYYQEDGHMRQDSMDPENFVDDPCDCPKELPKILEKRRKKEKQRCVAHSLVGTPNYIAPEVLLRQGYTRSCDWWSVGVILYEMVVGSPPFLANSPRETQYKVIQWKETLRIPQDIGLSKPVQDLIMKLCSGPENRLGKNGADEIKKHSFFNPIKIQDLRKQRAPHRPIINYPTDTSNFDEVEEMEPSPYQTDDLRQNGHYPEHAFSEFTYRRFFDDGGYAFPENLSNGLMNSLKISNNNINTGNHSAGGNQSDDRTPQNSYHEDELAGRSAASTNSGNTTSGAGNPVYV